jgi:transposase InsO family protein
LGTIEVHFYHPNLREIVDSVVGACDSCQRNKLPGRGYGELPPREADSVPWNEVAVDLVGPWTVLVQQQAFVFLALTCIDPVTGLAELIRLQDKTSAHVAMKFENEWLARYPRPLRCVHDQGGEFEGREFQHVLTMNGIKDVPTTAKNPQSNAIVERLHRTVEDCLRTLVHARPR